MRLRQANLASKNDIANLKKKKDIDDKLKILNKNVTSIKTKLCWLKMNLKNSVHLAQLLLLIKVTLLMMDHKIF